MKSFHKKILLDSKDKYLLKKHSWSDDGVYPQAMVNSKKTRLHNILFPPKKGFYVDHIDRNPLNNHRANLRYVTPGQSNMNKKKDKRNTTGHRGVYWKKQLKKWTAAIGFEDKQIHLGVFEKIEDAVQAYRVAADTLFGRYLGET